MSQQINLYQDVLRESPQPLRARRALLYAACVLFGLVLLAIVQERRNDHLQQQLAALQAREQSAEQRVGEMEKRYPPPRRDPQLAEKMQRLEQQILGQRAALDYFAEQRGGTNRNMLASLEGLARHSRKDVWLRKVRLAGQGRRVELSGTALDAEQIPAYVEMLGQENIFGGQVFARLQLTRQKEHHERIDFSLKSVKEATP